MLLKLNFRDELFQMNFSLEILFHQWVGPDDRNSSINIIQFDQMPMVSNVT